MKMKTAHATPELLAGYAQGTLSRGMSLLVASHLTYCAECRDKVSRLEVLGGVLLRDTPVADVTAPSLASVLARIDASVAEPAPELGFESRDEQAPYLPAPVRQLLAASGREIRWRFLLPGLSEYRFEGFDGEAVSLLRARPGIRILAHTHEGDEATLVLRGQLRDGDRVYARGEVSLADHHDDHRPEIVGDETCLCLVVLTGNMRFTGPVGRALNIFNG
jgi:putative transcriptional regulator